MPTNRTANYQLNQWVRSDKVQMEDFNADNAKIDAALKVASDARAAMQATLNQKGNCSIGTFNYQGNGKYGADNPTRITFPRVPAMYVILGSDLMIGSATQAIRSYSISGGYVVGGIKTTWSGSTLSFYDSTYNRQMNNSGTLYQVIAFYS